VNLLVKICGLTTHDALQEAFLERQAPRARICCPGVLPLARTIMIQDSTLY
jgi:hypothetical protein